MIKTEVQEKSIKGVAFYKSIDYLRPKDRKLVTDKSIKRTGYFLPPIRVGVSSCREGIASEGANPFL